MDGLISLGGRKFRVLLNTYRQRDLADFAPRASLPNQSIVQSELLLYQPLVMTDWRHGFGFQWLTDAMGYLRSEGGIDTRYGGMIVSAPKRQVIYHRTSGTDFTNPQWLRGVVYTRGEGGGGYTLRVIGWGAGMWSLTTSTIQQISNAPSSIQCALYTRKYLFVCPTSGRLRKFNVDDETFSNAGVNENAANYSWMVLHNGNVYAGKIGTNEIYYGSKDDLSDLHGSPQDDPNVIYAGFSGIPTRGAVQFAQSLYISKADGLYVLGEDNIVRRVLDFSSEQNPDKNFNLFTVYNGFLYFNIKGKIYLWNGARMQDVSIPPFNDTYPYIEVSQVITGAVQGGFLFVLAYWKPADRSGYIISLFAHDGVGWHKLHDFSYTYPSDGMGLYSWGQIPFISPIPKIGFAYTENSIVVGISHPSNSYLMSYYRFYLGDSLSPVAPFEPSGKFYSPRLDMGFRRVTKSAVQLQLEVQYASNNAKIEVYVSPDSDNTWTKIGTITSKGIHHLDFSAFNSITKTVEFRYIIIRLDYTATDTETPIVEGITLRFLMRPDVFYGWNLDIVASEEFTFDGQVFNVPPKDTIDFLKGLRDSKAPIEFIDLHGGQYYGYISAINVQSLELFEPASDGSTNIESIVNVNFVEAR